MVTDMRPYNKAVRMLRSCTHGQATVAIAYARLAMRQYRANYSIQHNLAIHIATTRSRYLI
jgi:hypothetical protein